MRWVGHVACMGEERKVYKVLVGRPKGKRAFGRLRHRWEDGNLMDIRDISTALIFCQDLRCIEYKAV
jgi:hypothetical protein